MFQGSFQWVSKVFERSSKVFQGCSKKVFRMLLGSFKGVSRKFQGYVKEY